MKVWSWGSQFYSLIGSEFGEKTSMARNLNVETIVMMKPQLVPASIWDKDSRVVKQLISLGIPVVCIDRENIGMIYKNHTPS